MGNTHFPAVTRAVLELDVCVRRDTNAMTLDEWMGSNILKSSMARFVEKGSPS